MTPPPTTASLPPATRNSRSGLRQHLWWISGALGAGAFAVAALLTRRGRDVSTIWEFAIELAAFGLVASAVALAPVARTRWFPLLYVAFVFFTGYLIPRISWYYYGDVDRAQGDGFYTHVYLLLYPGIVLTVTAAYRLGGGAAGRSLKVAVTGMIIVFSGFLDIMWQLVNPVPIPDMIDAPHITVLTGGPIAFEATIAFALAHLPVAVAVNLLPLDRWAARIGLPDAGRPIERPS